MSPISPNPNAEYVTYFLQSACGRFIKIGTTCNLEKRVGELRGEARYYSWLQPLLADGMRIVGYVPGSIDVERSIQRLFKDQQYRNRWHSDKRTEWHHATPELVAFVMMQTIPFTGFDSVKGVAIPAGMTLKELIARADTITWELPTPAPAPSAAESEAAALTGRTHESEAA